MGNCNDDMFCSQVPLFEMYANEAKYGGLVAAVPYLISRFHLNLESKQDKLYARTGGVS